MLQKRKNISIAGLYVCPNSIFWVTGALYCACFTDPGDGGYNDFNTGERKKSRNEHRRSKMGEQGHEEPTGQAKITKACNLPCRYVLHTVGPIVQGKLTEKHCALLRSVTCPVWNWHRHTGWKVWRSAVYPLGYSAFRTTRRRRLPYRRYRSIWRRLLTAVSKM